MPRADPNQSPKAVSKDVPAWFRNAVGKNYDRLVFDKFDQGLEHVGTARPLLGGDPKECPDRYALFSPVSHVHAGCPSTLLIHGAHDMMAPLTAARRMYRRLVAENVPTVMHIFPQTDHGFDLALPKNSPAAHNVIYDVERFLALMAVRTAALERKIAVTSQTIAPARADE